MTTDEMRIAIAKSAGMKVCEHGPNSWKHVGPEGDRELFCKDCDAYLNEVTRHPNYPEDLNAMNSAIASKPKPFRQRFETMMDSHCAERGKLWCELEAMDYATVYLQCLREEAILK